MALTTKEASYIIVLGLVISALPNNSTLLQDGYHVHFEQNSVDRREEEPIRQRGSPRNKRAQSIYFPTAFPMPFPVPIPFP